MSSFDSDWIACRDEAYEHLNTLESSLLDLEEFPEDTNTLGLVFRSLHSIKGLAAMAGYTELANFLHDMETIFDLVRGGTLALRNSVHAEDSRPLDEDCDCATCERFSRAYLHHLSKRKEMLAGILAGIHNMWFNMFDLAHEYAQGEGMKHYVEKVQAPEFAARDKGYSFVSHQQEVGAGYFDDITTVIQGGASLIIRDAVREYVRRECAPAHALDHGSHNRKLGALRTQVRRSHVSRRFLSAS